MIETLYHFPWTDIILTTIVSLLLLSLFVYMIMTIVDEDENYETYLLQVDGEPYLVVKKSTHRSASPKINPIHLGYQA